MKYFDTLSFAMEKLSKNKKTIFLGQAVEYPGTAMFNTLKKVDKKKLIELPVAEEMQMGLTIGYALNGDIPISIYPRYNFLLLAINQLVNHLDKIQKISNKVPFQNLFLTSFLTIKKMPREVFLLSSRSFWISVRQTHDLKEEYP